MHPSYGLVSNFSLHEPTSFNDAKKDRRCFGAMNGEYRALMQNNTYTFVPFESSMNIVGCYWISKIKKRIYGTNEHYRARLVEKGYM